MATALELILAEIDLNLMGVMARGRNEAPIVLETSKAITVAVSHPDIEARVVCRTVEDITDAALILHGPAATNHGGKWNKMGKCWEFPNGSAVVIKYEPPGAHR